MSQRLKLEEEFDWLIKRLTRNFTLCTAPHAAHGHRGRAPTDRRQITKTSAVNHKEIDTHGGNLMPLRRPWRTEKKNPVLDKVWTSQFSTTPPKPFLLSFSTYLGDQTLTRSIWKRKSRIDFGPRTTTRHGHWSTDHRCWRRSLTCGHSTKPAHSWVVLVEEEATWASSIGDSQLAQAS